jgi:hypothetical protein
MTKTDAALKACYDVLRELTDSGVVDLNSLPADLAGDITKALSLAEWPVAQFFGSAAVK